MRMCALRNAPWSVEHANLLALSRAPAALVRARVLACHTVRRRHQAGARVIYSYTVVVQSAVTVVWSFATVRLNLASLDLGTP